ncbi:MAG: DUF2023 family protein [Bacteroidales bacterium]|nr:DUF2023 family protein [Bacteroidales bacterium]
MRVLAHHIYEYEKGLRKLILHTLPAENREEAERKLQSTGAHYLIREVSVHKINIFFGDKDCVKVIESFGDKPLNLFTPEEDFILGTLLGYDRVQQCNRYLRLHEKLKRKTAISA